MQLKKEQEFSSKTDSARRVLDPGRKWLGTTYGSCSFACKPVSSDSCQSPPSFLLSLEIVLQGDIEMPFWSVLTEMPSVSKGIQLSEERLKIQICFLALEFIFLNFVYVQFSEQLRQTLLLRSHHLVDLLRKYKKE